MVSCKHCATLNSLDSTFCKKCGTPLADEDLKEAGEKLEAMIAEGVSLYNAGKIDEAMEVAEAAVASNPSSVSALSLMGDCHAHRGEIAEAIEAYERVVELNPDSALDKLRLNQLRNQIVLQARPVQPDRRIALLGGLSVVVLVVCMGAIFARSAAQSRQRQEIIAANQTSQADPNAPQQEFYQPPAQSSQQQQQPSQAQGGSPQNGSQQTGETQTGNREGGRSDDEPLPAPPSRGLGLPRASEGVNGNETAIEPVHPSISGSIGQGRENRQNPVTARPSGPDEDPPVSGSTQTTPKAPPEDNGIINIEVRGGNRGLPGGSQSTDGLSSQTLLRVARQQYQVGNYTSAATAYERALSSGADPVTVNQRLGQTYERLGRTGDAAAAYNRAISSAGSAISAGRGDRERLQTIQDSCRQALKVLQGG